MHFGIDDQILRGGAISGIPSLSPENRMPAQAIEALLRILMRSPENDKDVIHRYKLRESVATSKLSIEFFKGNSFITGRDVVERFLHHRFDLFEILIRRICCAPLIEHFFWGKLRAGFQLRTDELVKSVQLSEVVRSHG
jgi:hypothetical protein